LVAGNEVDHEVGGVTVEALAAVVVDGRRARVSMTSGDLELA
jgi:hypothetical protein